MEKNNIYYQEFRLKLDLKDNKFSVKIDNLLDDIIYQNEKHTAKINLII